MTIVGIYTHATPNHTIFYVGKGTFRRALYKGKLRNSVHRAILKRFKSDGVRINFIPCSSEEEAFEKEKILIKFFKEQGIPLANQTEGGRGAFGVQTKRSIKMRQKASWSRKGIPMSQQNKDALSKAMMGKRLSDTTKAKISKSHKERWLRIKNQ